MAERPLTPQTPDLEVCGSSVARQVVFLDKEPYYTFFLLLSSCECIGNTGDLLLVGNPAMY